MSYTPRGFNNSTDPRSLGVAAKQGSRIPSLLARLFVNRVSAEFLAVLFQFESLGASSFLGCAVIPLTALGAFKPHVFARHDFPFAPKITDPLDPKAAGDAKNYQVKVWGLERSKNYGSRHVGEKALKVARAAVSADGKTVRLEIPDLAPTWCMEVAYRVKGTDGRAVTGVIHNTIHELPE